MMPAATQALPTQPPEGAAEEVRAGDAAAPSLDPALLQPITPSLTGTCTGRPTEAETGGAA